MAFLGFANLFAMNGCLAVVIVAMVKSSNGKTITNFLLKSLFFFVLRVLILRF